MVINSTECVISADPQNSRRSNVQLAVLTRRIFRRKEKREKNFISTIIHYHWPNFVFILFFVLIFSTILVEVNASHSKSGRHRNRRRDSIRISETRSSSEIVRDYRSGRRQNSKDDSSIAEFVQTNSARSTKNTCLYCASVAYQALYKLNKIQNYLNMKQYGTEQIFGDWCDDPKTLDRSPRIPCDSACITLAETNFVGGFVKSLHVIRGCSSTLFMKASTETHLRQLGLLDRTKCEHVPNNYIFAGSFTSHENLTVCSCSGKDCNDYPKPPKPVSEFVRSGDWYLCLILIAVLSAVAVLTWCCYLP